MRDWHDMSDMPETMPTTPGLQRRQWLGACLAAGFGLAGRASWAQAPSAPPEVQTHWQSPRLQGQGLMRYFGLAVYRARLWTPSRVEAQSWWQQPFALELVYDRTLDGAALAERSLAEMRRQTTLASEQQTQWLDWMRQAFPNVQSGDRLSAVHAAQEPSLRFYFNGALRQTSRDREFARLFTGIWLSPQTSQPQLRQALLDLPA
jgi:hypothetical protein